MNLFKKRLLEEIKEKYILEKKLAEKLKRANQKERMDMYSKVYDDFYQKYGKSKKSYRRLISCFPNIILLYQFSLIKAFIKPSSKFLEIGAGDCKFAIKMSKYFKNIYVIDVSKEISKNITLPPNINLIISNGVDIALPENFINIAYSFSVIEHIHPEDLLIQLKNLRKCLSSDGIYISSTPNRLFGPHDISKFFERTATGFHLKEYTANELESVFQQAGFSRIVIFANLIWFTFKIPLRIIKAIESVLFLIPYIIRKKLAHTLFWVFTDINLIAYK